MELAPCKVLGGARRGGAARPSRLWRRPSARRRVACGGEVCGGGSTGTRRSGVVDFYEERRRSHRGHVRSREGGPSRRRRPQDASRKPLQCRLSQTLSLSEIARTTKGLSRRLHRLPKTLSRSQIARTTKGRPHAKSSAARTARPSLPAPQAPTSGRLRRFPPWTTNQQSRPLLRRQKSAGPTSAGSAAS